MNNQRAIRMVLRMLMRYGTRWMSNRNQAEGDDAKDRRAFRGNQPSGEAAKRMRALRRMTRF